METLYALAAQQRHEQLRRQFATPEWQHRAAALDAREPWRQRYMRQVRRLKLLASQSSQTVAATGSY